MSVVLSRTPRGRLLDDSPNPIDLYVGSRIRLRRVIVGITQGALADYVGLTFQQIQKYERGANRVGASRLYDIARALDVTVNYFFEEMPDRIAQSSPAQVTPNTESQVVELAKRELFETVKAVNAITPRQRAIVRDIIRGFNLAEDAT